MRMLVFILLVGCGSSGDDACSTDEVEVDYFQGDRDGDVLCKPIPTVCGGVGSCGDTDCIRDMYALCDSPYIGVGCSDSFPPTIISCNP